MRCDYWGTSISANRTIHPATHLAPDEPGGERVARSHTRHAHVKAVEAAPRAETVREKVHDLHVWTITSGPEALHVHVRLSENASLAEAQGVSERLKHCLKDEFGIDQSPFHLEFAELAESGRQPL